MNILWTIDDSDPWGEMSTIYVNVVWAPIDGLISYLDADELANASRYDAALQADHLVKVTVAVCGGDVLSLIRFTFRDASG